MTEIKTVKERLKEFINYIGIGQKKFETSCGLSNGYVNNIRVSIQPKTLQKIALTFPNLNQAWLLTGEGSMLNSGGAEASAPKPAARQEEGRKRGVIEMPEEVWDVLKEQSRTLAVQSESLAVRDRQVDELIGIIKKREGADVSDARTDAAACADAG